MNKNINIVDIAKICHELNKTYCETLQDYSQVSWDEAPEWQKNSAINGVIGIAKGKIQAPQESHKNWMQEKLDVGWSYGIEKDEDKLTHPCLVPFNKLPFEQQTKDYLFFNTVSVLVRREW